MSAFGFDNPNLTIVRKRRPRIISRGSKPKITKYQRRVAEKIFIKVFGGQQKTLAGNGNNDDDDDDDEEEEGEVDLSFLDDPEPKPRPDMIFLPSHVFFKIAEFIPNHQLMTYFDDLRKSHVFDTTIYNLLSDEPTLRCLIPKIPYVKVDDPYVKPLYFVPAHQELKTHFTFGEDVLFLDDQWEFPNYVVWPIIEGEGERSAFARIALWVIKNISQYKVQFKAFLDFFHLKDEFFALLFNVMKSGSQKPKKPFYFEKEVPDDERYTKHMRLFLGFDDMSYFSGQYKSHPFFKKRIDPRTNQPFIRYLQFFAAPRFLYRFKHIEVEKKVDYLKGVFLQLQENDIVSSPYFPIIMRKITQILGEFVLGDNYNLVIDMFKEVFFREVPFQYNVDMLCHMCWVSGFYEHFQENFFEFNDEMVSDDGEEILDYRPDTRRPMRKFIDDIVECFVELRKITGEPIKLSEFNFRKLFSLQGGVSFMPCLSLYTFFKLGFEKLLWRDVIVVDKKIVDKINKRNAKLLSLARAFIVNKPKFPKDSNWLRLHDGDVTFWLTEKDHLDYDELRRIRDLL